MLGDMSGKMENIIGRMNAAREKNDQAALNALKAVEGLSQISQFTSSAIGDVRAKKDEAKVDELNKAIKEAENKYQSLQQQSEFEIANNPGCHQVASAEYFEGHEITNAAPNSGISNERWLSPVLRKLEEAMTTLINIYDRIQSYQDRQQLANYIADMSSASASAINISDPNLVSAVNYLETSIKSNIVLNQYKTAIDSFKQWVFPFANSFLERAMLPSQLELDKDLEDLVSNAVTHIENLRTKVEIYKTSILINDKHLLRGRIQQPECLDGTIFRLEKEHYGNLISKLLSGQAVVFKAEIKNSVANKDAIKFSLIEFYFKSKNESLQSQINEALKRYDISATHLGNSYYRYKGKFYLIISDRQVIRYSFEKNSCGEPVRMNNVYMKIRNRDLMLSPYAVWEVKLTEPLINIQFKN
ncbi:uncharacterized protein CEXT_636851 [Caerostris extrusa]|uniref:Uncharacterized protein n=1 Tax=Caerostris extrusa TaxID=172846 RepID=A0AAV4MAY4_CAEEX|nr:uncharacterized protein CEXT_636851 [Caerostris extrusa]